MTQDYEVYAIEYGRVPARTGAENMMGGDPHETNATPLHFYVWLVRNAERTILVDTGFNAERAARRGRTIDRNPIEALARLGVAPGDVDTVIITHLHYDHAGNMDLLPNARFVLQDEEMRFATGRAMRHALMRHPFELGDVQLMVALNYAERVDWVQGDADIAPGVRVHHVPGHSMGLQAVTVDTTAGRICLASDTVHFHDNLDRGRPFPITADMVRHLEGQEKVSRLADPADLLIPGHDPRVNSTFAAVDADPLIFDLTRPIT